MGSLKTFHTNVANSFLQQIYNHDEAYYVPVIAYYYVPVIAYYYVPVIAYYYVPVIAYYYVPVIAYYSSFICKISCSFRLTCY